MNIPKPEEVSKYGQMAKQPATSFVTQLNALPKLIRYGIIVLLSSALSAALIILVDRSISYEKLALFVLCFDVLVVILWVVFIGKKVKNGKNEDPKRVSVLPSQSFSNQTDPHERAKQIYGAIFSNSDEIKQTMFMPKYTPLSTDISISTDTYQKTWIETGSRLVRIYGIQNAVDLESAALFFSKIEGKENVDVRIVDMLELPNKLRGMVPNLTVGFKSNHPSAYAISIPRNRAISPGEDFDETKYWDKAFELWLDQSEAFADVQEQLLRRINERYVSDVHEGVQQVFTDVRHFPPGSFSAAWVGSILDDNRRDWIHRDIDIFVLVDNSVDWPSVSKFKDQIQSDLTGRFSSSSRRIHVEFRDGPIKFPPKKGVETWQFHILLDTVDNALQWPAHTKLRRRDNNCRWLSIGGTDIQKKVQSALSAPMESSKAKDDVVTRSFGVIDCLRLLEKPIYSFKEVIGNFDQRIQRVSRNKEYLYSQKPDERHAERVWRDAYLLHYCVYNLCFNLGVFCQLDGGFGSSNQIRHGDLSTVKTTMQPLLQGDQYGAFAGFADQIDEFAKRVRAEFIFPVEDSHWQAKLMELEVHARELRQNVQQYFLHAIDKLKIRVPPR